MPFTIDLNDPNPELPMAEAVRKVRREFPTLDLDAFRLGYLMAFELCTKAHRVDRLRLESVLRKLQGLGESSAP